MLTRIKTLRKTNLVYIAFAVFYLWMAAQIPYTHDDWDWGLDIGLHQFIYATVNSRYVGNFFEVIMTRSELLKTLIMGAGYFLIPFFMSNIAAKFHSNTSDKFRLALFLACNCLLLTMNRAIWRQTYGWVAGYANFVLSVLFMMPWMNQIMSVFDDHSSEKKESILLLLFLFFLSICSQLFLENLALYHVFLALTLCVVHYLHKHRIPVKNLIMLLGATIGLFIMFSSSLYDTLFSTGQAVDNYRQIPLLTEGSLGNAVYQLCIACLHLGVRLYSENYVLTIFVLCILSMHLCTTEKLSKKKKRFLFAVNTLLSILVVCCFIYDSTTQNHTTYMYFFDLAVSIAYFCAVFLEVFLLFRDRLPILLVLYTLWLSAPIVIAPLIITTEIGARLFFTSNIFVILFALILAGDVHKYLHISTNKLIFRAAVLLTASLFILNGYIYAQIGACKRERDTLIQDAHHSSCTEICLPVYPFEEYLHAPNPTGDKRMQYFMEFYGIDPDVQVTFK